MKGIKMYCPKCKSENVKPTGLCIYTYPAYYEYKCEDCGYKFEIQEEVPEMEPIEIASQEDGTILANYIPIVKELE